MVAGTMTGSDLWNGISRYFLFSVSLTVAAARDGLHATPPRIGELGTKQFVFWNLHKNSESFEQTKKWKIFVLVNCEDLKIWNKVGSQILTSQKYPQSETCLARYSSETAGSLTKKRLRLYLQTVFWMCRAKKNKSENFFPSNFQRSWKHELSLWESGSLRQCFMGIC